MKMEHTISAPVTGTLSALHADPGRQVEVGALLAVVEAAITDGAVAEATAEDATAVADATREDQ
jgi:propionyl-CoA carboxylase alpha chain